MELARDEHSRNTEELELFNRDLPLVKIAINQYDCGLERLREELEFNLDN